MKAVSPLTWAEVTRFVQQQYGPEEEVRPGLTSAGIVQQLSSAEIGADVEPRNDVVFARRPERDLPMNVFGRSDHAERAPGVLVVHGGGWQGGDHNSYRHLAARLASGGWVAACPTYRLSQQATWPAQLEDVRAALGWLREHAGELGLDPSRLAVWGHSAGAHLAAMLALSPTAAVRAAVLFYPPCDLASLLTDSAAGEAVTNLLGDVTPERLRDASPVARIHAAAPPIFSVTGDRDPLTPHRQIIEFHLELSRAGLENELHLLAGRTHGFDFLPDDFLVSWGLAVGFLARQFAID